MPRGESGVFPRGDAGRRAVPSVLYSYATARSSPRDDPFAMSDTDPGNPGPQIQVDSDWKQQAQREKQKLAEKEKAAREPAPDKGTAGGATSAPPQGSRFPDADFAGLTNMMVSQALMAMGAMAHPQTGQPHVDLGLARHMIDLLGVVEEKTEGNLTEEEHKQLASTLYELRSSYVQIANASRSPATGGQGGL